MCTKVTTVQYNYAALKAKLHCSYPKKTCKAAISLLKSRLHSMTAHCRPLLHVEMSEWLECSSPTWQG